MVHEDDPASSGGYRIAPHASQLSSTAPENATMHWKSSSNCRRRKNTFHRASLRPSTLHSVKEAAFASLNKAYAEHDLQLRFLKVDPSYDPICNDPRFQELQRKVGLST